MKTNPDCLPCLLRQTLQTVRLSSASDELASRTAQEVAAYLSRCDLRKSPPEIAAEVYRIIEGITLVADPYEKKKQESNDVALKLVPALQEELQALGEEAAMRLAIRFAIAGNIIDYGAFHTVDLDGMLERCRTTPLAVDDRSSFMQRLDSLDAGAELLYLADNCGEIVFDNLLIAKLYERGLKITVAVKDGPIINDALAADAYIAGLDRYADIISNGTRCPGTVLNEVSERFMDIFNRADLIISKGQGNFESLSEVDREIIFLLTVKCPAAAKRIHELTGCNKAAVTGAGEMAVFHSSPKR